MQNKKTCLRCGNDYINLEQHTKNKKLCKSTYLNITYKEMLENYDINKLIYDELLNIDKFKCDRCDKIYKYKSGLSRHKNICYGNKNVQLNKKNGGDVINFNGDHSININNIQNNLFVELNDFGKEVNPDEKTFIEFIERHVRYDKNNKPILSIDIYQNFFKLVHIDIEKNRNIYIKSKNDGCIDLYNQGNWETQLRRKTKERIFSVIYNQFKYCISKLINKYKDKPNNAKILKTLDYANRFLDNMLHDTTKNQIFNEFEIVLHNNKQILKNTRNNIKSKYLIEDNKSNIINEIEEKNKVEYEVENKEEEEESIVSFTPEESMRLWKEHIAQSLITNSTLKQIKTI